MAKLLVYISVIGLFVFSWLHYDIGDMDKALVFGLSGLGIIAFSFLYRHVLKPAHDKASRDKFLDWIDENKIEIMQGEARYVLMPIHSETILTRYCVVFSFVSFARKTYTNYVIKGTHKAFFMGIAVNLSNLLTGWWHLPMGPIYTIQSVFINLSGDEDIIVGDIINSNFEINASSELE